MTRDRLPTGVVLQKAYGVLDKFKISRTFFVKTDQEGCAIAASDINAANGLTATSTVVEATGAEQKNLDTKPDEQPILTVPQEKIEEIPPVKAVPVAEILLQPSSTSSSTAKAEANLVEQPAQEEENGTTTAQA